ncbi:cupin [Kribbella sp. ALI-6-A]|uniref:cupin domain-containing protein n=1 Tax=Kribbella sp. ALI-6-A TaxID=1933817 RepID=UPI00097C39CA|nr:cupin domain-containing protein [Kribbella sp. ALI-6-A]ONI69916.1 cupin [Kribbella sp. ALI-6-A]
MKAEHEFFPVDQVAWTDAGGGTSQRVLSEGHDGELTRIAHWAPGTSSGDEVIRHEYFEEVYLLEGSLTDLTLGKTFGPGQYAARRPGMPHGPYRTEDGCTMLEIRYPADPTG